LIVVAILGTPVLVSPAAGDLGGLQGRWTLNRGLSQIPRDVGFGMDLLPAGTAGADGAARSGAASAGSPGAASFRESEDEAQRRVQLLDEVKSPSPHLTIVETASAVTITDDRGRSRTFHPDGKQELQPLDRTSVPTVASREGPRLEVRYSAGRNREVRYTYTRNPDPPQLVVQVRLVERGGHDSVTLVYEPARPDEPAAPESAAPRHAPAPPPGAAAGASRAQAPPAQANPVPPASPATPAPPARSNPATAPVGAPGPDAELRGLTALGVVIEELSPQAPTCGLSRAPIEAAVSKSLSDAGFKVLRNADEDTYLYVQIMTTSVSAGLCVSRFDAFVYTYTTTTLSYQVTPVLVQVSLLHKGGLAGGAPATHAEAVVRNLKQYVEGCAARIRAANR
jgi:hypothetical protein